MQKIQYNIPTCNDTAVCLCFFSPAGFIRPKMNFLYIESMLRSSNIPVFTVECVIKNQPPLLSNPTLQVKSGTPFFYKEHLYNLLVPKIPEQYTKLIFLDADVLFNDPNWIDGISKALDTHDIVQPFFLAHWLHADCKTILRSNNSTAYFLKNQDSLSNKDPYTYHPGFVWAMRRDFFNKVGGFFDRCLFGTGDTFFSHICIIDASNHKGRIAVCPLIDLEFDKWLLNVSKIPKTFTYLPFTIYHLYHGSLEDRGYRNRYDPINKIVNTNDWDTYFYRNSDNVYETKNPQLNKFLTDYFQSRNEDDCETVTKKFSLLPFKA